MRPLRTLQPLRNHRATIKHNITSSQPKPLPSHHLDVTRKTRKPDSLATFKTHKPIRRDNTSVPRKILPPYRVRPRPKAGMKRQKPAALQFWNPSIRTQHNAASDNSVMSYNPGQEHVNYAPKSHKTLCASAVTLDDSTRPPIKPNSVR